MVPKIQMMRPSESNSMLSEIFIRAPHIPSLGTVIVGIPPQEQGVRPGRALPYELNVFCGGRCFGSYCNPDVRQHRPCGGGVPGTLRQPCRLGANLHRRIREAAGGQVEGNL